MNDKLILSGGGAPKRRSPALATDFRGLLLLASLVTLGLWYMPYSDYLLYPLRLFVTFIHESGHAFAALISGGDVKSLQIHTDGSGVTMTSEPFWSIWLVLSGGYLGTTLFGASMLQVGRFSHVRNVGKTTLYLIAGYLALVTLLWGHNPFTLVAGIVLSAGLFALARFSPPRVAEFLAAFLAVQCCLNALGDLRILLQITSSGQGPDNDALFMSQHYLLPPIFWALLWSAMALGMLTLSLWSYLRAAARTTPKNPRALSTL